MSADSFGVNMHDDPHGERVAGWFHLVFTVAYVIAAIWHAKGALEHFRRSDDESKTIVRDNDLPSSGLLHRRSNSRLADIA